MTEKQGGVLAGMTVAMLITAATIIAGLRLQPAALLPHGAFPETLAAALRWDVLVVACLAACIANLARHRFFTPEDIDGGGLVPGTKQAHVLQAILQNTLEQVVLAVGVHSLWAVVMPPASQAVIPLAAILFVVGRVVFAFGYSAGAPARALGFGLTFYPTMVLLVMLLIALAA